MNHREAPEGTKQTRFSLSQETITVVTVGVAVAGILLATLGDMRTESRAAREALRAEVRIDLARIEATMNLMRAEGRADRQAFAKEITRLVEQQGTLNGLVDGLRNPIPPPRD